MACSATGEDEKRVNQFYKIRMMDDIANALINFSVQNISPELSDYVDLNCGAIPQGSYEQIIDPNAAHQFLSLYTKIAEKRFAFIVSKLIQIQSGLLNSIKDFLERTGTSLNVEKIETAREAFNVYQSIILDGMPCDETKELILDSPEKFEWKMLTDTHKDSWNSAGSSSEIYFQLLKSFTDGIFSRSDFRLTIKDGEFFSISKI